MRFVLCDDHRLFVEPLAAALAARGHEVVVATTPAQAYVLAEEQRPDLVVLDLGFPDGTGLETITRLCAREKSCPVVVLSGSAAPRDEAAALRAGAVAFLRKDQPVGILFEAFDRLLAGREFATPSVSPSSTLSSEYTRVQRLVALLTDRERQALHHLVRARDTTEIAQALGVAPSTARTHLENVRQKLGVHTRLQAVAVVVAAGVDGDL